MHLSCASYMPNARNFIMSFSNVWKEIKTWEEKKRNAWLLVEAWGLHHEWKMRNSFECLTIWKPEGFSNYKYFYTTFQLVSLLQVLTSQIVLEPYSFEISLWSVKRNAALFRFWIGRFRWNKLRLVSIATTELYDDAFASDKRLPRKKRKFVTIFLKLALP